MIALYAGSFDPFTIGHLDIVERALQLFDTVIIAVGENFNKKCLRPADFRVNAIKQRFAGNEKVRVCSYRGLTVDLAKEVHADILLRSVRNPADYEYERNLAEINRHLTGIETLIMIADPAIGYISSSMVRELIANGKDVSQYIGWSE